ncbi:WG repeat-containing protein [Xanthomarina sp. F1114]|uniref:WG repeat-containing protein n=1 Tax=Xanthomarina sp. F1114 TaxID=2996019 RepID=UPI00225E2770|nr:WG repeat-containing protein [Xanthomarina sp. F1114]MCX7546343.1 WG repeat-containing protein [Xanthomarina sp. F1114]
MKINKTHIILLSFIICSYVQGQEKFKIEVRQTDSGKEIYSIIDTKDQSIKELDNNKYSIYFGDNTYQYFAVFEIKGALDWYAIDKNEEVLFLVYNTNPGEPSPDKLIENKIRIVDKQGKIGFANYKGEVIIQPQFEIATSFHNGKAIVGQDCKNVPWHDHDQGEACNHYSIECQNNGYINEKGEVLKMGDFSFEEIREEIEWEKL